MNLDNLEQYIANKRVYSNDLNVILTRTPSRIFTFLLFAALFGLMILFFFGFFTRYAETVERSAMITQLNGRPAFYFVAAADSMERLRAVRRGIVTWQEKRQLVSRQVAFDSVVVHPLYAVGPATYERLEDLQKSGMAFDRLRVNYAVVCYPVLGQKVPGADPDKLVQLRFVLAQKRLISKYIKTSFFQ